MPIFARADRSRIFSIAFVRLMLVGFHFSACCGPGLFADESLRDQKNDTLKAVAEGYLSNREAFVALDCRFRIRAGEARTLDDARRGALIESVTADGLWIVNGSKVRFEIRCDPDAVSKALKEAFTQLKGRKEGTITLTLPTLPMQ